MRDLFDFGFNDLNRDGKIDAGERAFGFSVLNDMMRGNGKGDDDADDELVGEYEEDDEEDNDFDDPDSSDDDQDEDDCDDLDHDDIDEDDPFNDDDYEDDDSDSDDNIWEDDNEF